MNTAGDGDSTVWSINATERYEGVGTNEESDGPWDQGGGEAKTAIGERD